MIKKQKQPKEPVGFIVYQGPSALDPSTEVVVIVNKLKGDSANEKTGGMAQSFILRTDMKPNEALKVGKDNAVCGCCPYAGGNGCYVNMKMVCSVYGAFKRGSYKTATPAQVGVLAASRVVSGTLDGFRAGTYGDPAAAPFEVWDEMISPVRAAGGRTSGYTHQWSERYSYQGRTADPRFRTILMASTHGDVDTLIARASGWRAFASFNSLAELEAADVALCPASKEAGFRRTCGSCGKQSACNGRRDDDDRRVSMGIVVHGTQYVKGLAVKSNTKAQE
jgi:hypothetical protein